MSDPKIEAVQKLYEAFGRGDVDAILEELTDDVDWASVAGSSEDTALTAGLLQP